MVEQQKKKITIDPKVFFPPLVIAVILIAAVLNDIDAANAAISAAFTYVTHTFGWVFEWYIVATFLIWLWMVFGPWAKRRLGEEKPEFSTASWVFLLFASSTSAAVLFWGAIEVYYYATTPPFGYAPMSPEALEHSLAYALFHWGPISWSTFGFFTVAFAYFLYVKKIDVVRPSATVVAVIGEKNAKGLLGTIIDNLYLVALLLAMSTSLGLSTPLVTECLQWLFGIPHTLGLDAGIVLAWIIVNAICVTFGLEKGIKLASDLRSYLTILILAWVLCVGATSFTINYFTDSVGVFMNELGRMMFNTDSIRGTGFPQAWTVFYWAWWVIFTIQTCLFFARISRGRTVREISVAVVGGVTATTWLIWPILGSNTMHLLMTKAIDIPQLIDQYGVARAIIETWAALPMSTCTMVVFFVLCFLATLTLVNGCSYTLAMSTCKDVGGYDEPPVWVRVIWSLLVGAIALSLMALGGIKPLQTAIVVGGCLLFFVNIAVAWSFFKEARANQNWK